jgi:metal-responsive CopG/Arc/MetJ family transcriptional regulator
MNINIYIEDALGNALNEQTKKRGISRNAIVREAIREWVTRHEIKHWPNSVLAFKGISSIDSFESHRIELSSPKEDPFA